MDGKWFLRILAILVALVVLVGVGYAAFSMGVAQGAASKLAAASGPAGTTPVPYYGWPFWFNGSPFWGFHILGLFFGVFVLFFFLRLISFAVWGPRLGYWRHMHGHWDEEGGVPSRFREWHDRAHGAAEGEKRS